MRKEEVCKPEERFLFTDEIFSDELVAVVKNGCLQNPRRHRAQGSVDDRFINWTRKDNEIALFTLYAYADLELPKQFDCIFRLDAPSTFIVAKFKLTHSLYEAKYPIDTV